MLDLCKNVLFGAKVHYPRDKCFAFGLAYELKLTIQEVFPQE